MGWGLEVWGARPRMSVFVPSRGQVLDPALAWCRCWVVLRNMRVHLTFVRVSSAFPMQVLLYHVAPAAAC